MADIQDNAIWQLDFSQLKISERGVNAAYWPLQPKDMDMMRNDMICMLVMFINKYHRESASKAIIFNIAYPILFRELFDVLYALVIEKEAVKKKNKLSIPKEYNCFNLIFNDMNVENQLFRYLSCVEKKPNFFRKILRFGWGCARSFGHRICRYTVRPANFNDDIITTIIDSFPERVASDVKERVIYMRRSYWFGNVDLSKLKPLETFYEARDLLLLEYQNLLKRHNVILKDSLKTHLKDHIDKIIAIISYRYEKLLSEPKKIPKRLWAETGGSIYGRILAAAVRQNGGEVTRFDHAGGTNFLRNIDKAARELTLCDYFYTYSDTQANVWRDSGAFVFEKKMPEIIPVAKFVKWTEYRPKVVLKKRATPKKVMYVSTYFFGDEICATVSSLTDVMYLDWVIRLISMLKSFDFEVLHKPHPGTSHVLKKINPLYLGNVLTKSFEKCLFEADVVVIDQPASTTLNTALVSGIPIVFIDLKLARFAEGALNLLEKRCSTIYAEYDQHNRVQLDEKQLYNAINRAAALTTNNEFAKKYFQYDAGC